MPNPKIDDDTLIWGASAIAAAAGLFDEKGKPDDDAVYYAHKAKLLPIDKVGRRLVSTKRRLNAVGNGEAPKTVTT
jgi:hypothetical protein